MDRNEEPKPDRGVFALLAAALVTAPLQAVEIWTADFWWHAALGRHLVQERDIPRVDSFSFTVEGETIGLVNWLADGVFYAAFEAWGAAGIVALKMAWTVAAFFLMGLAARRFGARTSVVAAVMIALAVIDQPRLSMARPYNLGLIVMAGCMAVAAHWWRSRDHRVLWAFVPLTAVWIPLHGNALLVLPITAGMAGAVVIDRRGWQASGAAFGTAFGSALGVLAACTALFFLMRDGRDILGYFGMDTDDMLMQYNSEMQAASLAIRKNWIPYAVIAVGVVAGTVDALRGRRWLPAYALAGLGMVTSTQMARHAFEASFLAAPAFALAVSALADRLHRADLRLAERALAPTLCLGMVGGQLALEPDTAVRTTFGFGVDRMYPLDAWDAYAELPPGRTMHNLELGGFLMWMGLPDGVFVDGRTYWLYDDEDFEELVVRPVSGGDALAATADRWEIVYGFCQYRAALCSAFGASPDWLPIAYGDAGAVFVRRAYVDRLEGTSLHAMHELRWVDDPEWMAGWYRAVLAAPEGREALRAALEHAVDTNPDSDALLDAMSVIESLDPGFLVQP